MFKFEFISKDFLKCTKAPPLLATINCNRTPEIEYENNGRATCYKLEKASKKDLNIKRKTFFNFSFQLPVQIGPNLTYKYQRGCTVAGGIRDFCGEQFQLDPEVKCNLCKKDWCNHSNNLQFFKFLFVVVIVNVFYSINYARM